MTYLVWFRGESEFLFTVKEKRSHNVINLLLWNLTFGKVHKLTWHNFDAVFKHYLRFHYECFKKIKFLLWFLRTKITAFNTANKITYTLFFNCVIQKEEVFTTNKLESGLVIRFLRVQCSDPTYIWAYILSLHFEIYGGNKSFRTSVLPFTNKKKTKKNH